MTIDKTRRRFNIPDEWPRSLIESESAYVHRLIRTGVRYGVGAWCATDKHDACTDSPAGCRCYCHTPTKRFTAAELAAECHQARAAFERTKFSELSSGDDFTDDRWALVLGPMNTLHRFATLPHHDQENQ